jgi:CRP-like cAMP-binding protein
MKTYYKEYDQNEVVCREGDPSSELYLLRSGRLLICTLQGTEVKVLAEINPGEFIGELSFFDGKPRSSTIIALEKSTIFQIPKHQIADYLPDWYRFMGQSLTKKIRKIDSVVQESKLRKSPMTLPMDQQRKFYQIITQQNS